MDFGCAIDRRSGSVQTGSPGRNFTDCAATTGSRMRRLRQMAMRRARIMVSLGRPERQVLEGGAEFEVEARPLAARGDVDAQHDARGGLESDAAAEARTQALEVELGASREDL